MLRYPVPKSQIDVAQPFLTAVWRFGQDKLKTGENIQSKPNGNMLEATADRSYFSPEEFRESSIVLCIVLAWSVSNISR